MLRKFLDVCFVNCSKNLGKTWSRSKSVAVARQLETSVASPLENPLEDKFGRQHSYLRIAITEKCNLRCVYCMPEEGVELSPSDKLLSVDEIVRIASLFAEHGVDKIRFTGGEPTVRKDLVEIVGRLAVIPGIKVVAMTSNGIALSRKLEDLLKAGLNRLNISLDTLDEHKYQIISRRNGLKKVMQLIDMAESMFNPLKINTVVMRGTNDNEICDFVALTEKRNLDIRFIEYMPFGGNKFNANKMVSYKEMLKMIRARWPEVVRMRDQPNDTSKSYKVDGFCGNFGFITSMTEHFCGTCNRLRITADGNLKVCLHGNAEVSLRDIIRGGGSDDELIDVISKAVGRKKKQHAGMENLMKMTNRPMILIGG